MANDTARSGTDATSGGREDTARWVTLAQADRYDDRIEEADASGALDAGTDEPRWRLTLLSEATARTLVAGADWDAAGLDPAIAASAGDPRWDPSFRAEPNALAVDASVMRLWWVVPDASAPWGDAAVWTLALLVDALQARGVRRARLVLDTDAAAVLLAAAGDSYADPDASPSALVRARLRAQMVAFVLAQYRYTRYKAVPDAPRLRLTLPSRLAARVNIASIRAQVAGVTLARDLINTPPNDMMPGHLALVARDLAARHAAGLRVVSDDDALEAGYPMLAAVGRASSHSPRVIELSLGAADQPNRVIVGKGVCFDSGGLNLKPGESMRLMKKDMGGAAIALGLMHAVARARLPLRLTVLIGAVENAVAGDAFRPGDVLTARNGKTVEIDNTDAEGRLVLADLLVRAAELDAERVIDLATLTGAARVAVGTEISALFSDEWPRAALFEFLDLAQIVDDPIAVLPLHAGYRHALDSDVADLVNSASGPGGAIAAALFLREFAPRGRPWLHFDLMAYNLRARPGRPKGGEAMALRALYESLVNLSDTADSSR
ncbi:MAG: leucyl aminopeptidase family protein [Thioalkalivibrionaceae bacterium]